MTVERAAHLKVCFFAKGQAGKLSEGFYGEDIRILTELGHIVIPATKFKEIPWGCDLYFTWWPAWGFLSLVKSLLSRSPNIIVGPVHHRDREFGFYKRKWLRQLSIRLSLHLGGAAVAVSQIEYQGIKDLGARRPWMVYHSIVAPPSTPTLDERKALILSIGHLNSFTIARKRFDNVIRAIPMVLDRFPEARFVMIGRKEDGFDDLLLLVQQLGIENHIEFPGWVNESKKSDYLLQAKVLAQPTCYEGFGYAQLEGMAHGVPVVSSDAGAVREVLGQSGLYCDKDAPRDIARQIIRLLEDRDLWTNLSSAGRERALTRFTHELRKTQIAEIIRSVTNGAPNTDC